MSIESSRNTVESEVSPEFLKTTILDLTEEVYAQISRDYGQDFGNNSKEIYWQNACQQFSEIMKKKLEEQGISSSYVNVRLAGLKHHMFLSVGDYYLDGTWQQLLESPREDHHVLILDKNSPEISLKEAGVPQSLWSIYLPHP